MVHSGGNVPISVGNTCRSHDMASRWATICASRSLAGRVGNRSRMDSSVAAILAHSRRNLSAFRRPSATQSACAPVLTRAKAALGDGCSSAAVCRSVSILDYAQVELRSPSHFCTTQQGDAMPDGRLMVAAAFTLNLSPSICPGHHGGDW